ncbi:hypothetical protein E2C01_098230 [Portunus trituberculatus]|uniref:Uncharacterized protein n=1 Tax=Portunus trituberculatus TaxID=210409 RepID=A0A5B7K7Q6_PORTR|nr:hypothetical protein [Portunus trituberculatus]
MGAAVTGNEKDEELRGQAARVVSDEERKEKMYRERYIRHSGAASGRLARGDHEMSGSGRNGNGDKEGVERAKR